jgi:hypothetical protein
MVVTIRRLKRLLKVMGTHEIQFQNHGIMCDDGVKNSTQSGRSNSSERRRITWHEINLKYLQISMNNFCLCYKLQTW